MTDIKRKHISLEEWAHIRTRYEMGVPIADIAKVAGCSVSNIKKYSKRHKWSPHGSMSDSMIAAARKAASKRIKGVFENTAQEVVEKHLSAFRHVQDIAQQLMTGIWERVEFANASYEAAKSNGEILAPPDTGNEIYRLNQVADVLKKSMEAERMLLGISGDSIKEEDSGISAVCLILEQARQDYSDANMTTSVLQDRR
ncbi:helix-turn-helix domain-containing protein [Syntrophus buswellii]|uniref:helix-turn-helix domain-containing protein n=1 Tax=Syntrophus buswellii TaxID=43774 RepID=UPI0038D3980C